MGRTQTYSATSQLNVWLKSWISPAGAHHRLVDMNSRCKYKIKLRVVLVKLIGCSLSRWQCKVCEVVESCVKADDSEPSLRVYLQRSRADALSAGPCTWNLPDVWGIVVHTVNLIVPLLTAVSLMSLALSSLLHSSAGTSQKSKLNPCGIYRSNNKSDWKICFEGWSIKGEIRGKRSERVFLK